MTMNNEVRKGFGVTAAFGQLFKEWTFDRFAFGLGKGQSHIFKVFGN
jgi:hypothetical protein